MDMKPPIALVKHSAPAEVVAYACGECGEVVGSVRIHGDGAEKVAATHCTMPTCNRCGKPRDKRGYLNCEECRAILDEEKERAQFEKAEKVPSNKYSGPVYWEDGVGAGHDGFFEDLDDLDDWCEQEEHALPPYVWACDEHHPSLDVDQLCEQALDDTYDGCELDAVEELTAAVEAWNAKQTARIWEPDFRRAVVLTDVQFPLDKPSEVR